MQPQPGDELGPYSLEHLAEMNERFVERLERAFASGPGIFRRVSEVVLDRSGTPAPIENLIILDDAFEQADKDVAI